MDTALALAPSDRQILVNVGNRYVVFGPSAGLPQQLQFDPDVDAEILPRVADEEDIAGERIAKTLRVAGMRRSAASELSSDADIELIDENGNRFQVEVKVRERDLKARDIELGRELVNRAAKAGRHLELWYFNIERLKLVMMRLDHSQLRIDELNPLDVWEKTEQGVFTRSRVVEELDDWVRRIKDLYDEVRAWLADRPGLRAEQSRSVTVSEELMQEFAVADREVPVLDLLEADQPIASFVPRGLWLIGSWGRVDLITRDATHTLLALGPAEGFAWRLAVSGQRQSMRVFDKAAFLDLLSQP